MSSVCNIGESGPHRLEILEILGRLGGVRKSGVLEHKSSNICKTRKERGKVTMESL